MLDFGSLTLGDVRRGTLVQSRIIGALVMREMRTRFGDRHLGYAWALIEPLVQVGILVTIFSLLGRRPPLGTEFETFFLNGYVPYAFFSQISNRSAQAITANRALTMFPPVRNMDTVWARIMLETATGLTSFALIVVVFSYLGISVMPHDIVSYYFGFLSVICLGAGFGILNAAMSPLFGWWMVTFGWFTRFQYFFCGIFFVADNLPPGARRYLEWNPVTHCIIWIREGFYPGYDSAILDKSYPFAVAVTLAVIGLTVERVFRRQVDAL